MQIDILRRQGTDGDLVVKSIPDSSGAHMTLGVFWGKSIYYFRRLSGDLTTLNLSRCAAGNFFIINNPTAEELNIKNIILMKMNTES